MIGFRRDGEAIVVQRTCLTGSVQNPSSHKVPAELPDAEMEGTRGEQRNGIHVFISVYWVSLLLSLNLTFCS